MLEGFRALPKFAKEAVIGVPIAAVIVFGGRAGFNALDEGFSSGNGYSTRENVGPVELSKFGQTSEYAGKDNCKPTVTVPTGGEKTIVVGGTGGETQEVTIKDKNDTTMQLVRGEITLLDRIAPKGTIRVGTAQDSTCVVFERYTGVTGTVRQVVEATSGTLFGARG